MIMCKDNAQHGYTGESLTFIMDQAYLSLPEGTATAAGLIAMMIDHYNNLVRFKNWSCNLKFTGN